jgi:predicted aspartyl protease
VIQNRYSTALQPAAPILDVLLGHPSRPPPALSLEAQLDTGADRTVIPLDVVNRLVLKRVRYGQAVVAGCGVVVFEIYEIAITIPGVMDFVLEVAAGDEPHILLGRDVLNCLHTHLDGPGRILTLSAHPLLPPTP